MIIELWVPWDQEPVCSLRVNTDCSSLTLHASHQVHCVHITLLNLHKDPCLIDSFYSWRNVKSYTNIPRGGQSPWCTPLENSVVFVVLTPGVMNSSFVSGVSLERLKSWLSYSLATWPWACAFIPLGLNFNVCKIYNHSSVMWAFMGPSHRRLLLLFVEQGKKRSAKLQRK